jgi:hypothetical protein
MQLSTIVLKHNYELPCWMEPRDTTKVRHVALVWQTNSGYVRLQTCSGTWHKLVHYKLLPYRSLRVLLNPIPLLIRDRSFPQLRSEHTPHLPVHGTFHLQLIFCNLHSIFLYTFLSLLTFFQYRSFLYFPYFLLVHVFFFRSLFRHPPSITFYFISFLLSLPSLLNFF